MRAREMMSRLDRLPKKRGSEQKVWDLSLLSPEKQDRVDELFRLILGSKDIDSANLDTLIAEMDELVRNVPLLALQLHFSTTSESMGNHDSGDHGWLEHRLRRRLNCGHRHCGM